MSERILRRIARLSAPLSLEGAWSFLPASLGVRRLEESCEAVFTLLSQEFGDEELVAASIARRMENGDIVRTPAMSLDDPVYSFLTHRSTETLFDLVGLFGSLMHDDPPCFHAVNDHFTHNQLSKSYLGNSLFLSFDMQDFAILQCLGLPVTVSAGLSELKKNQLWALGGGVYSQEHHEELPIPAGIERAPSSSRGRKFVLVGWSLARLEITEPDGLRAVASYLNELEYAFGFNFGVEVWSPSRTDFQDIRVAVKTEHKGLIRLAMIRSVEESSYTLDEYATKVGGDSVESHTYLDARKQLNALLKKDRGPFWTGEQLKRVRKELNEAFERSIIDPLIHAAEQSREPVKRSLFLAASDLTRHVHDLSPIVAESSDENIRNGTLGKRLMTSGPWKEYCAAIDRLIAIQRAITPKK